MQNGKESETLTEGRLGIHVKTETVLLQNCIIIIIVCTLKNIIRFYPIFNYCVHFVFVDCFLFYWLRNELTPS